MRVYVRVSLISLSGWPCVGTRAPPPRHSCSIAFVFFFLGVCPCLPRPHPPTRYERRDESARPPNVGEATTRHPPPPSRTHRHTGACAPLEGNNKRERRAPSAHPHKKKTAEMHPPPRIDRAHDHSWRTKQLKQRACEKKKKRRLQGKDKLDKQEKKKI